MARRALVVAVLLWCGVARASIEPCAENVHALLPAEGATLPSNGKLWVLMDRLEVGTMLGPDQVRTPIAGTWDPVTHVTVFTPNVPPGEYLFEVHQYRRHITITSEVDTIAPAEPTVSEVALGILTREPTVGERDVSLIAIRQAYQADAELLRFTIHEPGRPDQTRIVEHGEHLRCDPTLGLSIGSGHPITFTFEALDLAGNASPSVSREVHDVYVDEGRHRRGCGLGDTMLLLFGGVVAVAFVLGTAVIGMVRRVGRGIAGELPAACSLLTAEALVRRARRWDSAWMFAGFGFSAALYAAWNVAAILSVPWTLMWILDYVLSARRMRIVETPGAIAELYGYNLIVKAGEKSSRLRLGRRGLARAHAAAVPTASTT